MKSREKNGAIKTGEGEGSTTQINVIKSKLVPNCPNKKATAWLKISKNAKQSYSALQVTAIHSENL